MFLMSEFERKFQFSKDSRRGAFSLSEDARKEAISGNPPYTVQKVLHGTKLLKCTVQYIKRYWVSTLLRCLNISYINAVENVCLDFLRFSYGRHAIIFSNEMKKFIVLKRLMSNRKSSFVWQEHINKVQLLLDKASL